VRFAASDDNNTFISFTTAAVAIEFLILLAAKFIPKNTRHWVIIYTFYVL
jgi:hypothetical protein